MSDTVINPDPLLTTEEAAAYLNVAPRMIIRMKTDGRLSPVYIGKFVRYRRSALDASVKG